LVYLSKALVTRKILAQLLELGGGAIAPLAMRLPPDTVTWHYPFGFCSFLSLMISIIMIWWSSSKIPAYATEWDPAKVLPIGSRTC